jgi:hypothetical protein
MLRTCAKRMSIRTLSFSAQTSGMLWLETETASSPGAAQARRATKDAAANPAANARRLMFTLSSEPIPRHNNHAAFGKERDSRT